MKQLLVVAFSLFVLNRDAQGQAKNFDGHKWEAPYALPVLKDWTIERFIIPPFFAPTILYKGVEDIRFAPGWGNAKSEEYWTYAFLWYLEEKPVINPEIIAGNLQAYYTGLIRINTDSAKMAGKKQVPVKTKFKQTETFTGDLVTYSGTIEMMDYMQQKAITLNCIVHFKFCEQINKSMLFYELSPQPLIHRVWVSLNQLWVDFKCTKNGQ